MVYLEGEKEKLRAKEEAAEVIEKLKTLANFRKG